MHPDELILIARIGAPHGVKGAVRVKAFTGDPAAIGDYGPLVARDGRRFEIVRLRLAKSAVVVSFADVEDRDAAAALNGTELFIARSALPESDDADEFYHADLIGLGASTPDGEPLGSVVAVHDFGAGDVLEIGREGDRARSKTRLFPFTKAVVREVDLAGGRLVVVPPPEVEVRGEAETQRGEEP